MLQNLMRRRMAASLAVCLLTCQLPMQAAVVAEFTDGNGITSPDQWVGVAGNGWATAWGTTATDATNTGVISSSPLHGGGNYLQVAKADATSQSYIRRQISTAGDVDLSQPHRISLSFRYDAGLNTFTAFSDRFALFGDAGAQTGSSASNTWLVGVAGGNSGASTNQSVYPGNWYFIDNNGNTNFSTSNMYDTGLALVEDRAYSIVVDVDPSSGTYAASIDDGVNPVVSQSNLTFRRGPGSVTASFFHVVGNSGSTDAQTYSVDNINVVPEPASLGFVGLATIGLLRRRRRR